MAVIYNPQCVQDGLVLCLDAANIRSYPQSGTVWRDVSGINTSGTLVDSPIFSNNYLVFDGTNDKVLVSTPSYSQWTIGMLIKMNLTDFVLSARTFFQNTPPGGTSAEGYLAVRDNLFHNVNTCHIDADKNIYTGGQHAGYNNTIAATVCKISPSGDLITEFDSPDHNAGAISCNTIYEYDGKILYCGTNLGNLGVTHVDKTTGLTTGIAQTTTATGAGGGSICSDIAVDSGNNFIYVIGNRATTYQNTATSGGLVKIDLTTKNIVSAFDTSTGFNSNAAPAFGVIDSGGNLYVVGDFTSYKGSGINRIIKINKTDASIDTSFNPGSGFNAIANHIVIDPSGRLIVGGNFTTYGSYTGKNRLVRINPNGALDTSFDVGTGFTTTQVRRIKIDPSGRLLVMGDFTSFNGVSTNRLVRLNENGSRDNSFDIGTGFNNSVKDVCFADSGKLIVVGEFSTYNDITTPAKICRLNDNGSYDATFAPSGFNVPLYRGEFNTRLAGGVAQNDFNGAFGISTGRNTFSLPGGSYQWNDYYYLNIAFSPDKVFKFYRNGVLVRSLASTGSANCNLSLNELLFRDNVYIFQLYNRELTQSEILKNIVAISGRIVR